jgi:ABC-2 type transport system ATP-binding protein/heme exporter protein A
MDIVLVYNLYLRDQCKNRNILNQSVNYAAMSMISIKKLNKSFGRKKILRNMDLEVKKGEFIALFGPNGAGKTTLIKILATLARPSSGKIEINGYDLYEDPIEIRRSIGVLSHNPLLYDDLTIRENLMFYSRMYGLKLKDKEILGFIKSVGLLHRANDKVGEFSRGMKQRAAVARVVLHDPPVLLLDEPYTGLDFKAWDMLNGMLKEYHKKGKTVLLITHNVDLGYENADRLAILAEGKVAWECKKTDLDLVSFKNKYRDLLEEKK